jgi:site-specific recombinase XerC
MKVGTYRQSGTHRILQALGKGNKERKLPLHHEAVERIEAWLDPSGIRGDLSPAAPCRR